MHMNLPETLLEEELEVEKGFEWIDGQLVEKALGAEGSNVTMKLEFGVKLIWILYPITRSIWVLRADGSAARLTEDKDLSGENIVPGFTCRIATLFAGIGTPRTLP
jgi:hypothetical protein